MNRDQLYRISNHRHYTNMVEDASRIVEDALGRFKNIAVGVSGGKDSVCMLHLVCQHTNPKVIFNDSGLDPPESLSLVEKLCEELGCELHVAKGNAIELWEKDKNQNDAIYEPIKEKLRELEIDLEFVGLRSAESRNRRMLIGKYGPIHNNKFWGVHTAWPMRRWLGSDCFAYLDEHNLPVHPAYLRCRGNQRDDLRVSWVFDSDREQYGDKEFLRRDYPKIYQELRKRGLL